MLRLNDLTAHGRKRQVLPDGVADTTIPAIETSVFIATRIDNDEKKI